MTGALADPAIVIRDLVVEFEGRRVLDDVSLEVEQGEILGLIGASGSGKSVLLRTMLGLVPKARGTIRILGSDRDMLAVEAIRAAERRWGVLFQHGALFSALDARANVELPIRESLQLPSALLADIATTKLAMVGLAARDAGKFPSELSGGMTKRVAIARALALEPDIVFLDEPTSGLDPIASSEIDRLIRSLRDTLGFTVLMVTHDPGCLSSICDRVAALADGKIAAIGSPAELRRSEHPWVKAYFESDRARHASRAQKATG